MKRRCIKIPKEKGESVRKMLLDLEILDNSLKISMDGAFLYIPLSREPTTDELKSLPEKTELIDFYFEFQKKKPLLKDFLDFSPSYEVIGDIALLEEGLGHQKASKIANFLIRTQPNIKTVLKPLTPVTGEFRLRKFGIIAGEPKTETIHKEYGCSYKVDLEKAYFTQRLSTERSRILSWIKEGDTIIDMFAGVGPYSILLAKSKKPSNVIAIDKNSDAVYYLKENITLNSAKNIEVIEGDSREEAKKFANTADHVIMNLPHSAHEFLDSAILLTKPGGIIHYYGIAPEDDLFEGYIKLISVAVERTRRHVKILEKRVVRSYAPHQYNICIEAKII